MPSGPGYVPDQLLPELAAQLPASWSPIPARMGPYEVVLSLLSKKIPHSFLGGAAAPPLPVYQIMGPVMPMAVPSRAPISTWGSVWPRCSFSFFLGLSSSGISFQWAIT